MKDIDKLIKKSKEVLLNCCLENGAIVAANSDRVDYPRDVQDYRLVWPRDASFICLALDILGEKDKQLDFFEWLWYRAEDLQQTGLLFQNYHTHGRKERGNFQPDQNGSVLFAIYNWANGSKEAAKPLKKLVTKLADGLCDAWEKDHFSIQTQDLWEERMTYPEFRMNHTYSLAACICGLEHADKLFPKKKWKSAAEQMRKIIGKAFNGKYFMRRFGENDDMCIDASVLGLLWPFKIISAEDPRLHSTIRAIEENITENHGVHRYQFDYYDGFQFQGTHAKRGSGAWPILSLWMAMTKDETRDNKSAEKYFKWVVKNIDENRNIPEQVFKNKKQVSIKPLAWSHAMFIISANKMGIAGIP